MYKNLVFTCFLLLFSLNLYCQDFNQSFSNWELVQDSTTIEYKDTIQIVQFENTFKLILGKNIVQKFFILEYEGKTLYLDEYGKLWKMDCLLDPHRVVLKQEKGIKSYTLFVN